jgi:hypothetical protein
MDFTIKVTDKMVSDLKLLKASYESFEIDFFFSHKVAGLLESTLGMRTVRDLVDVDPRRLFKVCFNFSKIDREAFWKSFVTLYQFFQMDNMLSTLKKLECPFNHLTVECFFDEVWARLLESALDIRTVRDLVNVEIINLYRTVLFDVSYVERRSFYENFTYLYDYFESY